MMAYTDTQLTAFQNIQEEASDRRAKILASFRSQGPATAWQMADRLGYGHRQDVAPRIHELLEANLIRDTNIRRVDARTGQPGIVWAANEEGL